MNDIDEKDQQVLDYILKYAQEHGYSPTIRDICAAFEFKSTSTAQRIKKNLIAAGYIKQESRKHSYTLENDSADYKEEYAEIPVIGRVAAGQPILAEQNIESYFPVPAAKLPSGTCFMLSVHGDSMIEAGILNGDYILVQQQNTANNGDIVVAMIDGIDSEATVKAFYKENGHIRLQPRNPEMEPIIVSDCTIVGKVKGVFRYL